MANLAYKSKYSMAEVEAILDSVKNKIDTAEVTKQIQEVNKTLTSINESLNELKSLNFVLYDDTETETVDSAKFWRIKSVGKATYGNHAEAGYWEIYNPNADINRLAGAAAKVYENDGLSEQYDYVGAVTVDYVDFENSRLFFAGELPTLSTKKKNYLLFDNEILNAAELQIVNANTEGLYKIDTTATETSDDGYVVNTNGTDFSTLKNQSMYLVLDDSAINNLSCNGYMGVLQTYSSVGNDLVSVKIADKYRVNITQKYPNNNSYLYINKKKYTYNPKTPYPEMTGWVDVDDKITIDDPEVPL